MTSPSDLALLNRRGSDRRQPNASCDGDVVVLVVDGDDGEDDSDVDFDADDFAAAAEILI
jgi:hypothetical protein